jgi:hypothetical protein
MLTFKLPNSFINITCIQTFIEDHPNIIFKITKYYLCFFNDYI